MKNRIFWGVGLLLIALLVILNLAGVQIITAISIPLWKLVVGLGLVWFCISMICKIKIPLIFIPIGFGFMMFEEEIAILTSSGTNDIFSNWTVLFASILLSIGTALLIPRQMFIKYKKRKTENKNHKFQSKSRRTQYIDCKELSIVNIENNLGLCDVYFTNVDLYNGDGVLNIENNLGRIIFHVPAQISIDVGFENNLGNVSIDESCVNRGSLKLTVNGENSLGKIDFVAV